MIISHKYRFIFIKTHKTAGSSMEMALAPLCGRNDIVTPMESNAQTNLPRNFYEESWLGRMYSNFRLFRKCINRHSPFIGKWYYEHMPAWRVRELIGKKTWNSYHKFCFERNPWEKVVSYYNWKKFGQKRRMPEFKKYVMEKSHRLPMDARLYFDRDQCIVNEVADYSDFLNKFAEICQKLSIPYEGNMPREKTNIASDNIDYRDFYDDETKEKVAELFQREIRLRGFVFESIASRS